MPNFVFTTVPLVETTYPPAAYGCLQPIVSRNGLDMVLNDFNLYLKHNLDSAVFEEINHWSMFSLNDISEHAKQKLCALFDKSIAGLDIKWLAISVFSFYSTRPTALLLKHLQNRNIKILLGGNGCMGRLAEFDHLPFGKWCLKNNLCSHVIFGEGEQALDKLLQNKSGPGIDNIDFVQITDLDQLEFPDYSGIDWSMYANPRILITGSRGCVRHCTFCDIDLTWPKFSFRSAEKLVEEIRRAVHRYGLTHFEFTDSLINGSVSNFNRFNELLIEAKQSDPAMAAITYTGQFICRNRTAMSERTYELMHRAGCAQITVGIESFSEQVRWHMKKKFSNEDIDYHLEQCARWRIPNVLLLIVGYPTETAEDHAQNLLALNKYKHYSDMGVIALARWGLTMHVHEDTPIWNLSQDLGITVDQQGTRESVFDWVSTSNPDLTLKERIRRRLEIHETGVRLGYAMPNNKKELLTLLSIAKQTHKKIFKIHQS